MQSFLMHYGIKGQKYGVRRFQNEDGTLTEEGRRRYLEDPYHIVNDHIQEQVYNKTNTDLKKLNKKYKRVDLNDDRNNLQYMKDIRDSWQKNYRKILAKDMGTKPETLIGQKWLKNISGYESPVDSDIKDLEKKLKKR